MLKTKKHLQKILGWTGIVLCGLCCTLPIIGTAIGLGSLAVISIYAEKIGIMALVLAAFFFWSAWYYKKKKIKNAATCNKNCICKTAATPQRK